MTKRGGFLYTGGIATAVALGLGGGGGLPPVVDCTSPWQAAFPSPGMCGFPDPAFGNVGVPAGTSLTPSGGFTVSVPGTVINALDVSGAAPAGSSVIVVNANNVTIQNSRITATGAGCGAATCGNSTIQLNCVCTLTLSHDEVTANSPTTVEHAIRNDSGGTLHIDHVYQHGNTDALCFCGNATISDTYSIIHLAIADDHLENLYIDDATVSVTHSTLLNSEPQTSNVFGNVNNGGGGPCLNKLTIKNNLMAGGGFLMDVCAHSTSVGSSTLDVENNRFARCDHGTEVPGGGGTWLCPSGADSNGYFPRGGSFGYLADAYCASPSTTWTNNVYDDDQTLQVC